MRFSMRLIICRLAASGAKPPFTGMTAECRTGHAAPARPIAMDVAITD